MICVRVASHGGRIPIGSRSANDRWGKKRAKEADGRSRGNGEMRLPKLTTMTKFYPICC